MGRQMKKAGIYNKKQKDSRMDRKDIGQMERKVSRKEAGKQGDRRLVGQTERRRCSIYVRKSVCVLATLQEHKEWERWRGLLSS